MVGFLFMVGFIWAYFLIWGNLAGKYLQSGFGGIIFCIIIVYVYVHPFDPSFSVSTITGFHSVFVHDYVKDFLFLLGFANAFFDFKSRIMEAMEMGVASALEEMKYRTLELVESAKSQVLNFVNRHQYKQRIDEQEADLKAERERREQAERREQKYREEAKKTKAEKNSYQNSTPNSDDLDPTKLEDAYAILGVEYGTDKETCKAHFRRLMAMYHPDKLAKFSGWRKEKMERDAKAIGVAWDTIKSK